MYFRMAGAIVLVALGIQSRINAQSKAVFDGFKVVDKNGNISKLGDYRDIFKMIGAYAVIDPKGNELHYSYASPGAIDSYRRNKKFADGTVLVKEVFGTEHAQLTTGNAHWRPTSKCGLSLSKMQRADIRTTRFGETVGALFKSDAPDKQVAVDYKRTA